MSDGECMKDVRHCNRGPYLKLNVGVTFKTIDRWRYRQKDNQSKATSTKDQYHSITCRGDGSVFTRCPNELNSNLDPTAESRCL